MKVGINHNLLELNPTRRDFFTQLAGKVNGQKLLRHCEEGARPDKAIPISGDCFGLMPSQ